MGGGQEKFEEFNGALWFEAGKGAKEFADAFGLATEGAEDIEAVTHLLAKASMGAGIRVRARRVDPVPGRRTDHALPLAPGIEDQRSPEE